MEPIIKYLAQDHSPVYASAATLQFCVLSGRADLLKQFISTPHSQARNTAANLERVWNIVEYAITMHEVEALRKLLDSVSVQKALHKDSRVLQCAIDERCPKMIEMLINKQNVLQAFPDGQTPLSIAAELESLSAIAIIVECMRGNFTDSVATSKALRVVISGAIQDDDPTLLKSFLDRGGRMRFEHLRLTALHLAAEGGKVSVMQMLLNNMSVGRIAAEIIKNDGTDGGCLLRTW